MESESHPLGKGKLIIIIIIISHQFTFPLYDFGVSQNASVFFVQSAGQIGGRGGRASNLGINLGKLRSLFFCGLVCP